MERNLPKATKQQNQNFQAYSLAAKLCAQGGAYVPVVRFCIQGGLVQSPLEMCLKTFGQSRAHPVIFPLLFGSACAEWESNQVKRPGKELSAIEGSRNQGLEALNTRRLSGSYTPPHFPQCPSSSGPE
jgi:hypothetical protein